MAGPGDAHHGRKAPVEYEDLRADTLGVVTRIHPEIGIEFNMIAIARVIEANVWENAPRKGRGESFTGQISFELAGRR